MTDNGRFNDGPTWAQEAVVRLQREPDFLDGADPPAGDFDAPLDDWRAWLGRSRPEDLLSQEEARALRARLEEIVNSEVPRWETDEDAELSRLRREIETDNKRRWLFSVADREERARHELISAPMIATKRAEVEQRIKVLEATGKQGTDLLWSESHRLARHAAARNDAKVFAGQHGPDERLLRRLGTSEAWRKALLALGEAHRAAEQLLRADEATVAGGVLAPIEESHGRAPGDLGRGLLAFRESRDLLEVAFTAAGDLARAAECRLEAAGLDAGEGAPKIGTRGRPRQTLRDAVARAVEAWKLTGYDQKTRQDLARAFEGMYPPAELSTDRRSRLARALENSTRKKRKLDLKAGRRAAKARDTAT